jgi:hypothetical protein
MNGLIAQTLMPALAIGAFYFLNTLKSLSRTGFSIFARASNSPASSHIPLQDEHSPTKHQPHSFNNTEDYW